MKTSLNNGRSSPTPNRRNERGVAIIMVIVFLVVMAGLVSLNSRVLSRFKQEVQLIERKQEQRWKRNPRVVFQESIDENENQTEEDAPRNSDSE